MMMTRSRFLVAVVLLCLSWTGRAVAQQPAPSPPLKPNVQVKVDVILSRYQGEKKTSSLPFSVWVDVPGVVNRTASASVRMGVDVPLGNRTTMTTTPRPERSDTVTSTNSAVEYRNVGTSVDCQLGQLEDGRFSVDVRVQDSSIHTAETPSRGVPKISDPLAFRTFSLVNKLPMRDGQTLQYAVATDKISGETVKVDVTLNVLK